MHLLVVGLVALLALVGTGYAMLRARPVPLTLPASAQAPSSVAATGPSAPAAGSPSAAPGNPRTASAQVVVHVLGAVRRPGVVELDPGSRVTDAIEAAGGLRRDAAPGELNLAQVLTDGQQVVVGTTKDPAGEVRGSSGSTSSDATSAPGGSSTGSAEPLDLNAATAAQLETLPGVGPVTAAGIIAWREQHGRFSRVEELQEVDGIGPKTYAQIEPHVRV